MGHYAAMVVGATEIAAGLIGNAALLLAKSEVRDY